MKDLLNTSYRNKFILVVLAIIGLFWVSWNLSFAPTKALLKNKNELNLRMTEAASLQLYLQQMQLEKKQLESVLGSSEITPEQMQIGIVDYVAMKAEDRPVKIEELYPLHLVREQDCQIATQTIVVSGEYSDLVKLCWAFETDFSLARLASVNYWTETDPRTRKKKLYATYYLQNIQKAA